MNVTNGAVMERPRTGLIRRMFCALDSPTAEELSVCGVPGLPEPGRGGGAGGRFPDLLVAQLRRSPAL